MSTNGQIDKSLLQFPCRYPIKIVGENHKDFVPTVHARLREHVGDNPHWSARQSQNGRYVSITLTFTAESEAHIQKLHLLIKDIPGLSMVF